MAFELRDYSGSAVSTALAAGVSAGDTTLSLLASTGWPAGGVAGPFFAVVDPDTPSEEKVKVAARSGLSLTGVTRGVDGTAAVSHASGATVRHVFTAVDADEANTHYADPTLDHHTQYTKKSILTATGDIYYASGASTPARLAVGTAGQVLSVVAGVPAWAAALSPTAATVTTLETTTSTTYADLATAGPAVTLTPGPSGKALVFISGQIVADAANTALISLDISGGTTLAAADSNSLSLDTGTAMRATRVLYLTGLAAVSTTFTLKYRASSAVSVSFRDRNLVVLPV